MSAMPCAACAVHCLWQNPLWFISLLTSREARVDRANSLRFDTFMGNVTRKLQARPLDEIPSDCIAGALMRVTLPSGKPLPFHQLKSNISVMLAAGAFPCLGASHALAAC
jgi:hypothetical protein